MNQKEIKELIELLVEKDITEFELERGDMKVHVKRGGSAAPVVQVAPIAAVQPLVAASAAPVISSAASSSAPAVEASSSAAAPSQEAASEADLFIVKSPIVGTFYEAASPDTPPFVRIGEHVTPGKVLCIIESMKLMNEIEADVAGVIESKLVQNGQPVEYGEALFGIRPV